MRTHATKHATNRVGKTIPKNCHIVGNVLEISRFPSPISRFPSPKIQFSSHGIRFTQIGFLPSSTAFRLLQWLSDFLQWLSAFSNDFQFYPTAFWFSSTAFHFPRNPRKSIYGKKYTKDRYSSLVFFATCSSSFVISAKQYLRLTQQWSVWGGVFFLFWGRELNDKKITKIKYNEGLRCLPFDILSCNNQPKTHGHDGGGMG